MTQIDFTQVKVFTAGFIPQFLQQGAKYSNMFKRQNPRIIGGHDAELGRYPYAQISLQRHGGGHVCGASLLAPDIIISAAHCQNLFDFIVVNHYNVSDSDNSIEFFD